MEPASPEDRLSFRRRGSLACLLASHVSGWFSHPDDNHSGWRDAYKVLKTRRLAPDAFMMQRNLFALTAFGALSTKVILEDTTLAQMLPMSFVAISRSTAPATRQVPAPQTGVQRVQTINATVAVAAPAQANSLTQGYVLYSIGQLVIHVLIIIIL